MGRNIEWRHIAFPIKDTAAANVCWQLQWIGCCHHHKAEFKKKEEQKTKRRFQVQNTKPLLVGIEYAIDIGLGQTNNAFLIIKGCHI